MSDGPLTHTSATWSITTTATRSSHGNNASVNTPHS